MKIRSRKISPQRRRCIRCEDILTSKEWFVCELCETQSFKLKDKRLGNAKDRHRQFLIELDEDNLFQCLTCRRILSKKIENKTEPGRCTLCKPK